MIPNVVLPIRSDRTNGGQHFIGPKSNTCEYPICFPIAASGTNSCIILSSEDRAIRTFPNDLLAPSAISACQEYPRGNRANYLVLISEPASVDSLGFGETGIHLCLEVRRLAFPFICHCALTGIRGFCVHGTCQWPL